MKWNILGNVGYVEPRRHGDGNASIAAFPND